MIIGAFFSGVVILNKLEPKILGAGAVVDAGEGTIGGAKGG